MSASRIVVCIFLSTWFATHSHRCALNENSFTSLSSDATDNTTVSPGSKHLFYMTHDLIKKMGRYVKRGGSIEFGWVGFTFAMQVTTIDTVCDPESSIEIDVCFGTRTTDEHRFGVRRYRMEGEPSTGTPALGTEDVDAKQTIRAKKPKASDQVWHSCETVAIYPSCGDIINEYQFMQETEKCDFTGEVQDSRVEVVGIKVPSTHTLKQMTPSKRRILIFGDSDSVGFCTQQPEAFSDWTMKALTKNGWTFPTAQWEKSNTGVAWSSRIAKLLDADSEILAISGIGVRRCPASDSFETMPPRAGRAFPFSKEDDEFVEPKPDAVIIELTANDFFPYKEIWGSETLKLITEPITAATKGLVTAAYTLFVDQLLSDYPNAQIFLMVGGSGGWIGPEQYSTMKSAIQDLYDNIKSNHDKLTTYYAQKKLDEDPGPFRLHMLEVTYKVLKMLQDDQAQYIRYMGHWSPAGHEVVASTVAPSIASVMQNLAQVRGWESAYEPWEA